MTDVIITTVESLLVEEGAGDVVVAHSNPAELIADRQTEIAILSELVTETIAIVTAGPQGPAGTSEDEMAFAKRVDFVGDTTIYRGEAVPGTLDSAPAWRVRRLTLAGDDVTEEWASGAAAFAHSWAQRATLEYS